MLKDARVPLLGFAAYSGTGKTTLLLKLVPLLRARGLRVGLVKHAHEGFEIDHPGKDSYALRKSGATQVLVASPVRRALVVENPRREEPRLERLLGELHREELDLVLVEGFRHERFPKIELHRPSLGHPLLFPSDTSVIAVATDAPIVHETTLPVLDLNRPDQILRFILPALLAGVGDELPGA